MSRLKENPTLNVPAFKDSAFRFKDYPLSGLSESSEVDG